MKNDVADPALLSRSSKPATTHNNLSILFSVLLIPLFFLLPCQKVVATGETCSECPSQNLTQHQQQWLCNNCFRLYSEAQFKELAPSSKGIITSAIDVLTQRVSNMSLKEKGGNATALTIAAASAYAGHLEIAAPIGIVVVAREYMKGNFSRTDKKSTEKQGDRKGPSLPPFLSARESLKTLEDQPEDLYVGDNNTVLTTFKSCLDGNISASKEIIELDLVYRWAETPQTIPDQSSLAANSLLLKMINVEQALLPPDISKLNDVTAMRLKKGQREYFEAINKTEDKENAKQAVMSFLDQMKPHQTFALFLEKVGVFGIHMTDKDSFYIYDPLADKIFLFDGDTPQDQMSTYIRTVCEHAGDTIKLYKTPKATKTEDRPDSEKSEEED